MFMLVLLAVLTFFFAAAWVNACQRLKRERERAEVDRSVVVRLHLITRAPASPRDGSTVHGLARAAAGA